MQNTIWLLPMTVTRWSQELTLRLANPGTEDGQNQVNCPDL